MKNAKLFLRLSGYFLMTALLLGFGGGTLRAQDTFVKIDVSLASIDRDAEYLIVYENTPTQGVYADIYAADGYSGVSVSISDGTITIADGVNPCTFSFTTEGSTYAIKDNKQDLYVLYNSGTTFKTQAAIKYDWSIKDDKETEGFRMLCGYSMRTLAYGLNEGKFAPYATTMIGTNYVLVNLYIIDNHSLITTH